MLLVVVVVLVVLVVLVVVLVVLVVVLVVLVVLLLLLLLLRTLSRLRSAADAMCKATGNPNHSCYTVLAIMGAAELVVGVIWMAMFAQAWIMWMPILAMGAISVASKFTGKSSTAMPLVKSICGGIIVGVLLLCCVGAGFITALLGVGSAALASVQFNTPSQCMAFTTLQSCFVLGCGWKPSTSTCGVDPDIAACNANMQAPRLGANATCTNTNGQSCSYVHAAGKHGCKSLPGVQVIQDTCCVPETAGIAMAAGAAGDAAGKSKSAAGHFTAVCVFSFLVFTIGTVAACVLGCCNSDKGGMVGANMYAAQADVIQPNVQGQPYMAQQPVYTNAKAVPVQPYV